jgi:hypothetical protein
LALQLVALQTLFGSAAVIVAKHKSDLQGTELGALFLPTCLTLGVIAVILALIAGWVALALGRDLSHKIWVRYPSVLGQIASFTVHLLLFPPVLFLSAAMPLVIVASAFEAVR